MASRSRTGWRVLIALLIIANVAVIGAFLYVRNLRQDVSETVEIAEGIDEVLTPIRTDVDDPPVIIALLGSDSRENLPEEWEDDFADVGGARADVIMLIQLIPAEGRALVLSIPRDLRVAIEGHGNQKLNAAYAFGQGPLMVSTIQDVLGVPINHYVEVDFVGFASMVDEVGGISIDFPYAARDLKSGFAVEAGTQTLDGESALALARSRSYQELRDGTWVFVEANDIGRTKRQQRLLVGLLNELRSPAGVFEFDDTITALAEHVTVDAALLDIDLVDFLIDFRNLNPSSVETATLPTTTEVIDGVFFEVLAEPEGEAVLATFRGAGPLEAAVAGPIRVMVLNGNGVAGAAGAVADDLEDRGFEIAGVGDAPSFDNATTRILVRPGDEEDGAAVAATLGFGEVENDDIQGDASVILIIGQDAA